MRQEEEYRERDDDEDNLRGALGRQALRLSQRRVDPSTDRPGARTIERDENPRHDAQRQKHGPAITGEETEVRDVLEEGSVNTGGGRRRVAARRSGHDRGEGRHAQDSRQELEVE